MLPLLLTLAFFSLLGEKLGILAAALHSRRVVFLFLYELFLYP